MSNKQSYPIHIRVSKELLTLVDQVRIADKHDSRASVGRAALRNYLEKQEDQIGNRRHFTKSMSDRMDRLEQMLVQIQVNQTATMIMGAQIGSEILTAITGKKDLNAALAVKEAFDVAQEQHDNVQNRSKEIVAMLLQKAQQQSETPDTSE
jgi:metal-responsive CopG/Arc/MetJ family transcriptional regulator